MRKATPTPTIVRHSNHAEWGLGFIVEENPGKLHVSFENGGARHFVNDPKFRQLLPKVDLPAEEAKALLARIEKGDAPAPKKKTAKKKAQ